MLLSSARRSGHLQCVRPYNNRPFFFLGFAFIPHKNRTGIGCPYFRPSPDYRPRYVFISIVSVFDSTVSRSQSTRLNVRLVVKHLHVIERVLTDRPSRYGQICRGYQHTCNFEGTYLPLHVYMAIRERTLRNPRFKGQNMRKMYTTHSSTSLAYDYRHGGWP